MPHNSYPTSVNEVIDKQLSFSPDTLRTVVAFARSGPWQGSWNSRKKKFLRLNQALAVANGISEPELLFSLLEGSTGSGASYYAPSQHRIVLVGKLSVVTFLHEFAHALGKDEREACRWSVNLFRRCFPRQYRRLVHCGHMLVRPEDVGAFVRRKSAS